jgi:hypothetical protein
MITYGGAIKLLHNTGFFFITDSNFKFFAPFRYIAKSEICVFKLAYNTIIFSGGQSEIFKINNLNNGVVSL